MCTMATLWLGGSEEDVEHRRMLVGLWQDRAGSTYMVSPGNKMTTLSVSTTRLDGQNRYTKDLIDTSCGTVTWGKEMSEILSMSKGGEDLSVIENSVS